MLVYFVCLRYNIVINVPIPKKITPHAIHFVMKSTTSLNYHPTGLCSSHTVRKLWKYYTPVDASRAKLLAPTIDSTRKAKGAI